MQLVGAALTLLLGYACPMLRLRVRCLPGTVYVYFCVTESILFLGFVYVVVITLASHVFEYFLTFLATSLRPKK